MRCPRRRLQSGTYTLSVPSVAVDKIDAAAFEGDVATRKGIGGVAALDEVTMLVMPDIVNLNGDGAQMRDLQGKMIAHCEHIGRPDGDPRRAARPAARRTCSSGG